MHAPLSLTALWLVATATIATAMPTVILGRPTHRAITLNIRPEAPSECYVEYGTGADALEQQSSRLTGDSALPAELTLDGLSTDTRYFYRLQCRPARSQSSFEAGELHTFHTQRAAGARFTFAAQGDSHPEREHKMFSPDLYRQTIDAVAADQPDFFFTSGDDFSVDTLRTHTRETVTERYTLQVPYLARMAHSTPLMLVNGNHEQAARYLLDGTPNNVAVWAQTARNRFFPQPAPDGFYTGNPEVVPHIGPLRNYFAWEWGDALFVVIDPYWSSPVAVDGALGSRSGKSSDRWDITHGDAQYAWLKQTLEDSRARWKFVFAHHVMGSGRGGVEVASQYEWGGRTTGGRWEFDSERPDWPLPIHQLFVTTGVTIFFQGHDHLFARQELDGVIYQSLPNPADDTYTAFNRDAYQTGDVLPNAGYVRVHVSPDDVRVEYVRQYLPQDEHEGQRSGDVAFSYTIPASSPRILRR
jgi:hypothetical protein